jgi:hypothetical protein
MRSILLMALVLASCSQAQQPAEPSIPTGVFAGQGSGDRLCIAGEAGHYRAGLIIYGKGAVNCSAVGRIEGEGTNMALVPRGEGDCRIPLSIDGDMMRIGTVPAACSYYCGPGAKLAGNAFSLANPAQTRDGSPAIAVDLAGDPLC